MLTSTNHRFVSWRAYHHRLGLSRVVYRSGTRSLRRSTARSLGYHGRILLRATLLQGPERAERRAERAERKLRRHQSRNRETDPEVTIWLIEYNFNRPHQSLGYLAPIEYIERELAKICSPVLPLWSASTVF